MFLGSSIGSLQLETRFTFYNNGGRLIYSRFCAQINSLLI